MALSLSTVVTFIGTSTVTTTLGVYIAKHIISNFITLQFDRQSAQIQTELNMKLEEYRASLASRNAAYSEFHEKQVEVICELYSSIQRTWELVRTLTTYYIGENSDQSDKYLTPAEQQHKKTMLYFESKCIFLDEHMESETRRLITELEQMLNMHKEAFKNGPKTPNDSLITQSIKKLTHDIPRLQKTFKETARNIISVSTPY